MKKLDEIMELMADEMADFKSSLLKLEALSKELHDMSIPISTAAMEGKLGEFLRNQEEAVSSRDALFLDIQNQLKRARLIPKSVMIIFGSSLLVLLMALGYFIYAARLEEKRRFELYQGISQSELECYTIYFSENPDIKADYCTWFEDQLNFSRKG